MMKSYIGQRRPITGGDFDIRTVLGPSRVAGLLGEGCQSVGSAGPVGGYWDVGFEGWLLPFIGLAFSLGPGAGWTGGSWSWRRGLAGPKGYSVVKDRPGGAWIS